MLATIDNGVSVKKPHDPGFGITSDTAAESCNLSLSNLLNFGLCDKTGLEPFRFGFNKIRCSLPTRLHLADFIDTSHSFWQLRFINNSGFTAGFDNTTGFIHAKSICGTTNVFTRIFRIHPAKIHSNITKIKDGSESVFEWKSFSIEEPFHLHVRIA